MDEPVPITQDTALSTEGNKLALCEMKTIHIEQGAHKSLIYSRRSVLMLRLTLEPERTPFRVSNTYRHESPFQPLQKAHHESAYGHTISRFLWKSKF